MAHALATEYSFLEWNTDRVSKLSESSAQLIHVVCRALGSALELAGDDAARERATASDAQKERTSRREARVLHQRYVRSLPRVEPEAAPPSHFEHIWYLVFCISVASWRQLEFHLQHG